MAATGLAVTLTVVSACQASLEGRGQEYDSSGAAIFLTFGTDNAISVVTSGDAVAPPDGAILKYDVRDEVFPKRLYLQLEVGDYGATPDPAGSLQDLTGPSRDL